MTEQSQSSQTQDQKNNDKEFNFRQLESKYQRELAQERAARLEAEKIAQEARQRQTVDEDDDSEPYVDHKKLKKEQAKFGQQIKQETQSEIQRAVQTAIQQERKEAWLKQNADFYDVMQHAEKIPQRDGELAELLLKMPDSFERQQLVYRNIKALGLHQPQAKEPSIQEKIDSNRKGAFYQPSGVGTAPYASSSDFSSSGQKNAYDKMQELKGRLRLS